MNAGDPPNPAPRLPLIAFVVVAIAGLIIGAGVEEWRWRRSPLTPQGDVEVAENAFRSGDNQTALQLFRKLADQNNPVAQYWLAHMIELGLGVPRDPAKAIELYKKAAAKNMEAAELRLGEIYLHGNIATPDFAQAKSYLEKAAYHGDARAAMLLGQMYRLGLGTTSNLKEAYAWSEVASLEGDVFAKRERDASLHDLGVDDQQGAITEAHNILKEIKQETTAPPATTAK